MYALAHIGIGYGMAKSAAQALRTKVESRALVVGTLLPDLIDKPIYYSLVLFTGKHGEELGFLASTRNFAHTFLFAIALGLGVRWVRESWRLTLRSLAYGTITHQFLDLFGDFYKSSNMASENWQWRLSGYLWPFLGWQFPATPYKSLGEQLGRWLTPYSLITEGIGFILIWYYFARPKKSAP